VLGLRLDFWLVSSRYIPDIEAGVKQIECLYYLKYLPNWYWYKASIVSTHTKLVESLRAGRMLCIISNIYQNGIGIRLVLSQLILN
jgi:hypothetical protein